MSAHQPERTQIGDRMQWFMAQAWEEGVATALDFAVRGDDGISLSLDRAAHPNPYLRPSLDEHPGCTRRIESGQIHYACGVSVAVGTPDAYAEHVRVLRGSLAGGDDRG